VTTVANTAAIREAGPGRYRVEGAMTMATVVTLRSEGLRAFARATGAIEVDLADVRRADSGGLALLIDWLAWARRARRTLSYASLPSAVRSLAQLSDVEPLLAGTGSAPTQA
jgi:phospholipid transport system transporter-binding protein